VDFVVVGFGLGALGILLGVVMLGWLAPRSHRAAARISSPDDAARRRATAAEHHGTGQAFLYAGGAMLLATVAALVGSLDDRTGALLVTTTATVAAVGILLGGYLQRVRTPSPPRQRTRSAPALSESSVATPRPGDLSSFLTDESPWVQDPAPAESSSERSPTDLASPGAAPVVAETTDSGNWQPADHAADNGSGNRDLAETEEAVVVEHVAPAAGATESSPSRPDDDPSSGHS
jgi:hypothetical protein